MTDTERRLRLAHQARRAKERQLDDIRRALCDAGLMRDDDPYSHADLADVIRQTATVPAADLAAAPDPTPLRWGLDDVLHGDDDTTTILLSGPGGEPYWLELEPDRVAALREALAGPDGPAVDGLLHLVDRAEDGRLLPGEAQRLRDGIRAMAAGAPRSALSAPQTAEPPAPGPEQHPGGENGPQTGVQRAELHRLFKGAITRRWDVAPFVIDEIVDDAVDRHLDLVDRATADLRHRIDEYRKSRRRWMDAAFKDRAVSNAAHDRAHRAEAALDVVALELEHWDGEKSLDLLRRELGIYRALATPQAGDDTTGATP